MLISVIIYSDARFGFESLNYWLSERPGIVPIPIVLLEHELAVPASVQLTASDVSASRLKLKFIKLISLHITLLL